MMVHISVYGREQQAVQEVMDETRRQYGARIRVRKIKRGELGDWRIYGNLIPEPPPRPSRSDDPPQRSS